MNGTEIRQLNVEDAAEYQAVFLGALQSSPAAFAADYGEESARSSDQIAERFRREVIFGAFVDGRLCAIATFLQQTALKRRQVGMIRNDMEHVRIGGTTGNRFRRHAFQVRPRTGWVPST
jgi:hypothetical protein